MSDQLLHINIKPNVQSRKLDSNDSYCNLYEKNVDKWKIAHSRSASSLEMQHLVWSWSCIVIAILQWSKLSSEQQQSAG